MPADAVQSTLSMFTSVSIDTVVLVCAAALGIGWGLWRGKEEQVTLLLGIFPAALLVSTVPGYAMEDQTPIVTIGVAFAALIAGYLLMRKYVRSYYSSKKSARILEATFLGILLSGAMVHYLYAYSLIEALYRFSPPVEQYLTGPYADFAWFAVPLAVLLFIVRK